MTPLPLPVLVTGRVEVAGVLVVLVVEVLVAKMAVRLVLLSTTRAQPPVPVQAPLQPVKVEPAAGVALRAMLVPLR
jgi:hypothetical protein